MPAGRSMDTKPLIVPGAHKKKRRRFGAMLSGFGRRLLVCSRSYLLYALVVACFIFVAFSERKAPPKPKAETDSVVAHANQEQLDEIQRSPPELQPHLRAANKSRQPIVLYWHRYFVDEYDLFVPKNAEIECPYRCLHTDDREHAAEAAVRVFHERSFDPDDLPPANPRAYNVYHTLEPPFLTFSAYAKPGKPLLLDYFNATSSYRSKSAVFYPYDRFVKRMGDEKPAEVWSEKEVDAKVAKKKRPVLIAYSNCNSHSARQDYVKELSKHLHVTILGLCPGANAKCEKDPDGRALRRDMPCLQQLNEEHFFYLAFENSVCPEYVSEKFFRAKQLIVPVVLSRAVMPPDIPADSYIAASDFDSPAALAHHLKHLMNNRTEYKKYFNWTKSYRKSRLAESEVRVACQLCKLAHNQQSMRIRDYKAYWTTEECPQDYAHLLVSDHKKAKAAEQKLAALMRETYRPRFIDRIL
ncbi:Alpha-(1,3)-fucosyltransferase C [Aphelenchoides fujianensis]|nr:Alpha-(1,3)-fucosyltransferase C [Aphelenchoides fujianensis]